MISFEAHFETVFKWKLSVGPNVILCDNYGHIIATNIIGFPFRDY